MAVMELVGLVVVAMVSRGSCENESGSHGG